MIDVGCPGCTPTSQYSWKIHSGPFSLEACICETLSARRRCDRSDLVVARGGEPSMPDSRANFYHAGLPRADPFSAAGACSLKRSLDWPVSSQPAHAIPSCAPQTSQFVRGPSCLSSQLRYGPQTRPAS